MGNTGAARELRPWYRDPKEKNYQAPSQDVEVANPKGASAIKEKSRLAGWRGIEGGRREPGRRFREKHPKAGGQD